MIMFILEESMISPFQFILIPDMFLQKVSYVVFKILMLKLWS